MKVQSALAKRIHGLCAEWSNSAIVVSAFCTFLLAVLLVGCGRPSVHEPVTITFLDQRWVSKEVVHEYEEELRQFTRETGIQVKFPPSPEANLEQLALLRELIATGASGPDVYGIDVIWPGILNEYFIDLKPYFANEISAHFPLIVSNFTVDNKLVAMPYRADIGLLYYRADLLRQYGYHAPPNTWDELESMAARIQAGERAKGKKDFWGFVWQGTPTEGLTAEALEWQAAEGGGQIIEKDKTISVNNPRAIRTWQRAARWVGSISPPSVVAFLEWDAENVWAAGDVAFMRAWTEALPDNQAAGSPLRNKFDVTLLPGAKAGAVENLGGTGLAVSRFSAHPREAVELVRYLTRRDVQVRRARVLSVLPTRPELYELPDVVAANPRFPLMLQAFRTGLILRPAALTGKKYEDVSTACSRAVHSVLTREQSAPEAAAALERDLVRITGFKPGPPPGGSAHP